ncbi:SERTA domain-containing protein 3 [Stygiomarasmius scandens]|uniref:SERTA domain-containing protein 3 n=1 Tax=Marasmiellus scandens TaxID=2682957 RepID=A0ABR1ILF7_9AGAR
MSIVQSLPKRKAGENIDEDNFTKVRIVPQRDYQELILQQQLNSELEETISEMEQLAGGSKREIERLENEVSTLKNLRDNLSAEVTELEDAVTELQNAENQELDQLAKANTNLSRELRRKNIEIQTLQDLVRSFNSLKVTVGDPSSPSTILQEDTGSEMEQDSTQTSQSIPIVNEVADESGEKEVNSFEREASVLRGVQPENIFPACPVPFPLDAIHSKQAQKWFHEAYNYVNVDLGADYAALLTAWIGFERLNGWKKSKGGLPTTKRPQEITKWIVGGRYPPRYMWPVMNKTFVVNFSEQMRNWWKALWSTTHLDQERTDGDWASLDKYGINGWYSIITGLKWWGSGIPLLDGEERKDWDEKWLKTVKEALTTLKSLHTYRTSN